MWFVPPPLENPSKDKQEDREDGGGGGDLSTEWESRPDPDNVAQLSRGLLWGQKEQVPEHMIPGTRMELCVKPESGTLRTI